MSRATSPSSWMATAAGRSAGACRAWPATGAASRTVRSTIALLRRGRRRIPDAVRLQQRELAASRRRGLVSHAVVHARARERGEQAAREWRPLAGGRVTCRSFEPRAGRSSSAEAEQLTAANTRLTLTIAANYGGRWDIMQAVNRMLKDHPDRAGGFNEAHLGPSSGVELRARARPVHPHRRRAARQQLLPVAAGLHRAVLHRRPVARLRRSRRSRRP